MRTQAGLNDLKAAAEDARSELAERIDAARARSDRLGRLIGEADVKVDALGHAQSAIRAPRPNLLRSIAEVEGPPAAGPARPGDPARAQAHAGRSVARERGRRTVRSRAALPVGLGRRPPMKSAPRFLPLVLIAAGGVLAVRLVGGAASLPQIAEGPRPWAEDLAPGSKSRLRPPAPPPRPTRPPPPLPAGPAPSAPIMAANTAPPPPVCAPTPAELAQQAGAVSRRTADLAEPWRAPHPARPARAGHEHPARASGRGRVQGRRQAEAIERAEERHAGPAGPGRRARSPPRWIDWSMCSRP